MSQANVRPILLRQDEPGTIQYNEAPLYAWHDVINKWDCFDFISTVDSSKPDNAVETLSFFDGKNKEKKERKKKRKKPLSDITRKHETAYMHDTM